jgi:hypothetical protein
VTAVAASPDNVGRAYARQIFSAIESPAACDRGALLELADAFLRESLGARYSDGLQLARTMSHAAVEFAVFGDGYYHKLARAVECYRMSLALNK